METKLIRDIELKELRDKAAEAIKDEAVLKYIEARIDNRMNGIEVRNSNAMDSLHEFGSADDLIKLLTSVIEQKKDEAVAKIKELQSSHREEIIGLVNTAIALHYSKGDSDNAIKEVIEDELLKMMTSFQESQEVVLKKVIKVSVDKFNNSINYNNLKGLSECSSIQLGLLQTSMRVVSHTEVKLIGELHKHKAAFIEGGEYNESV